MSDKMQEEFETWFAKTYPLGNLERDTEEVLRKMIASQAWHASRSALLKCSCCGLTDTAIQKVCHNSDCAEYAQEEELFNGWEEPC